MQSGSKTPLISIITAVRNGEAHLQQAMQSVFEQSYTNVEYIIIDGGSTDGTQDMISKIRHRLAYYVSEKDNGIAEAWNKGIGRAKGEIVGILNADDWYEKEALEKVAVYFQQADIFYGQLRYWKDGKEAHTVLPRQELLNREMSLSHPAVFVRRKLYDENGNFNPAFRYAMDYEFLLRCHVAGCRFKYVESVLANMRAEGLSDRQWLQGIREVRKAKNTHLKNPVSNYLWFLKQASMIMLSRSLSSIGMEGVVKIYRRFSPVKRL